MEKPLEEEIIRDILHAASEDFDYPSDLEMSDINSDDEADDEVGQVTAQEKNEVINLLSDTFTQQLLEQYSLKDSLPDFQVADLSDAGSSNIIGQESDLPDLAMPGPSGLANTLSFIGHDHSYIEAEVQKNSNTNCRPVKPSIPNNRKNKNPKPNTNERHVPIIPIIKWTAGKDNDFTDNHPPYKGKTSVNIDGETPLDFFQELFPDSLFETIMEETKRYALQKNNNIFKLSLQELKTFFGINIMMTYIKYPQSRMYWSSISGLRMDFIANSMSCGKFEDIRRFLHFVNNDEENNLKANDKYWKIRPIVKVLHENFHKAKTEEENQSIDEMVIPFKGRSHLKQYIKNKPKKWGFKVWVRSGASGYVHCFELYSGKQNNVTRSVLGPVGDMVLRLCHTIEGNDNKLFMDNYFVSIPLLRKLRDKGIYVIGTVRLDRVPKEARDSLVDPKLLKRGQMTITTSDDSLTLVRWMDTKPVHVISTYAGSQPEDKAKRYDRSAKERIEVSRPYAVQQYNMFMGGVDLVDRMVAHYPHGFKNKKWYLRIVFHFLNVTIVNAWHLFKLKTNQPSYPLLLFKASLATSLMSQSFHARKRGRPSNESLEESAYKKRPAPPKMAIEVRFDGVGHYPMKIETQHPPRCHDKACKSRTRFKCGKCDEPVCPTCMENFHKK